MKIQDTTRKPRGKRPFFVLKQACAFRLLNAQIYHNLDALFKVHAARERAVQKKATNEQNVNDCEPVIRVSSLSFSERCHRWYRDRTLTYKTPLPTEDPADRNTMPSAITEAQLKPAAMPSAVTEV